MGTSEVLTMVAQRTTAIVGSLAMLAGIVFSVHHEQIPYYTATGEQRLRHDGLEFPERDFPPNYGPNPTGTVDEITGVGGNTVYSATGSGSWRMVAGPPTTPTNLPASRTNCYTTSCAVP